MIIVCHSAHDNIHKGLAVSFCSNSNHFINLIPPESTQILELDIVVIIYVQNERGCAVQIGHFFSTSEDV